MPIFWLWERTGTLGSENLSLEEPRREYFHARPGRHCYRIDERWQIEQRHARPARQRHQRRAHHAHAGGKSRQIEVAVTTFAGRSRWPPASRRSITRINDLS